MAKFLLKNVKKIFSVITLFAFYYIKVKDFSINLCIKECNVPVWKLYIHLIYIYSQLKISDGGPDRER